MSVLLGIACAGSERAPPGRSIIFCAGGGRSGPDLPRRLDHQFEFALLVVFADQVADDVRAKAALRAECQLLERQVFGRLTDAALESRVHRAPLAP
jgi:hypothetical protein